MFSVREVTQYVTRSFQPRRYHPQEEVLLSTNGVNARTDVHTAVILEIQGLWGVTNCLWVKGSRRFGDTAFIRNVRTAYSATLRHFPENLLSELTFSLRVQNITSLKNKTY
jgi:hypothetical protein